MLYDLITLNGVSETQTQKQKIYGQNFENVHLLFWRLNWSYRNWFILHLASFKAPSAHRSFSQRLSGRRLSGQVARFDSLVVIQLFVLHHAGTNFLNLQRHKAIGLL